jgi:hypothetical protein
VKDSIGYTDHKVDMETSLQASKPTARQTQELKEQITQVWDNEDSLFATSMLGFATAPASSTSASSGAAGNISKLPEVNVGNRKAKNRGGGRGGKGGGTAAAREVAAPSSSGNGMAVEAQRFRKNTIKACGQRAASR